MCSRDTAPAIQRASSATTGERSCTCTCASRPRAHARARSCGSRVSTLPREDRPDRARVAGRVEREHVTRGRAVAERERTRRACTTRPHDARDSAVPIVPRYTPALRGTNGTRARPRQKNPKNFFCGSTWSNVQFWGPVSPGWVAPSPKLGFSSPRNQHRRPRHQGAPSNAPAASPQPVLQLNSERCRGMAHTGPLGPQSQTHGNWRNECSGQQTARTGPNVEENNASAKVSTSAIPW